jgi:hypothetical protein
MDRSLNPHPFAYPTGIHVRRHGPAGWRDYSRYRSWLRDEFCFRCVYCLNRERWMDTRRGYQIDHFVPQKLRPELKAGYDNLLYLCAACNNLKGASLLPDPCATALAECLRFHDDGSVEPIAADAATAERLIEVLELDHPELIEYRRSKIGAIKSHSIHNGQLYLQEMGLPTNLPDLAIDPPPRNSRPAGVGQSWFALKCAGSPVLVY